MVWFGPEGSKSIIINLNSYKVGIELLGQLKKNKKMLRSFHPIQSIHVLSLTETCPAPALLRDLLKKMLFFAMPEQQRT